MRLTVGLPLATTAPEGLELALGTVRRLNAQFLAALPLVGLALVVGIVGITLALALAAGVRRAVAFPGILENLIAGVILLARRPFHAGDQIRTNDLEGTVEEIDVARRVLKRAVAAVEGVLEEPVPEGCWPSWGTRA